jgi:hypothetical protein
MMMDVLAAATMPVVEDMHQWTGEEEQIRQNSQHMGAVLREQQETGNGEKTVKHPTPSG